MRKTIFVTIFLLAIIGFFSVESSSAASINNALLISPSQVIAAINNYRQQNGIQALSTNSTLMSLAQVQSNYQASIGTYSHTGPDGSTPTERAYAAGYGGGNKIFLSEIVYMGYQATIDDAMSWWKESPLHNRVMLDSQYLEIGAGVATDGDWTYFTAEIAWVTGISAPAGIGESSSNGDAGESQDDSTYIPVTIIKATPNEDGSIIHIIQKGQTPWAIAAVYGVDLDTLLDQNQLTRTSFVFPGDKIIVKLPDSSASTPEPSGQDTPGLSSTEETNPQAIGEAVSFSATKSQNTQTAKFSTPTTIISSPEEATENPSVQWVIILAFVVIFVVVVGSLFIQKPPERPPGDDVVR